MNWMTRVFLVGLRLVIGCHFLIEGMTKVENPRWTSADYLRNASGPLAARFQAMAPDPVLEYYTLQPEKPDGPHTRMPVALDREWDAYLAQFEKHYIEGGRARFMEDIRKAGVPAGEEVAGANALFDKQKDASRQKLLEQKAKFVEWMEKGTKVVKRTGPSGDTANLEKTIPERLDEYKKKLEEIDTMQKKELSFFSASVHPKYSEKDKTQVTAAQYDPKVRIARLKAEAATWRAELLADIADQTNEMKKELAKLLDPDPKELDEISKQIVANQKNLGPVPEPYWPHYRTWMPLRTVDWLFAWGLAAVGLSLVVSALAVCFGSLLAKADFGLLGWVGGLLAITAGVILILIALGTLSLKQLGGLAGLADFENLVTQWRRGEWLYWFVLWTLPVIGACLTINLIAKAVVRFRDWGRLGRGGWVVNLLGVALGTCLLAGAGVYVYRTWPGSGSVATLDWMVIWGVTIVGVCLLLGFMTRSACVAGIFLLLMFMLPAWPETARDAGLFLKNIIIMVALVTLATTHSGRWLGVDGPLQFLNPWRWLPPREPDVPQGPRVPTPASRLGIVHR